MRRARAIEPLAAPVRQCARAGGLSDPSRWTADRRVRSSPNLALARVLASKQLCDWELHSAHVTPDPTRPPTPGLFEDCKFTRGPQIRMHNSQHKTRIANTLTRSLEKGKRECASVCVRSPASRRVVSRRRITSVEDLWRSDRTCQLSSVHRVARNHVNVPVPTRSE